MTRFSAINPALSTLSAKSTEKVTFRWPLPALLCSLAVRLVSDNGTSCKSCIINNIYIIYIDILEVTDPQQHPERLQNPPSLPDRVLVPSNPLISRHLAHLVLCQKYAKNMLQPCQNCVILRCVRRSMHGHSTQHGATHCTL